MQRRAARHPVVVVQMVMLAAIVLAGFLLRAYKLSARSFWFDEAFSWRIIQFPFAEMLDRVEQDNHPLLYFVLLKAWATAFGNSVFALRLLSVLCSTATIVGMYLFAIAAFTLSEGTPADKERSLRRGRIIGLIAAALLAVSVFQIRWAWEVRMYSLGGALVVFSSWALMLALKEKERPYRYWTLYALLALGCLYTHYYTLFSVAAQALFLAGYLLVQSKFHPRAVLQSQAFRGSVLAGTLIVLGWLPWVPILLQQRVQVQDDYWSQPIGAWDVPHVCYQMLVEPEDATLEQRYSAAATAICAVVLLGLFWRPKSAEWYVFVAAVIPFAMSVGITVLDTKIFHLRYFIFSHIWFVMAAAVLLARIPWSDVRVLIVALVVFDCSAAYVQFWQKLKIPYKPGAQDATRFIEDRRNSGEPVVVCSPLLYFSVLYHTPNREDWYVYTGGEPTRHYEGAAILTEGVEWDSRNLRNAAKSKSRVWAVDMTGWGYRSVPVPDDWVLLEQKRFPEVYGVQGVIVVRAYDTAGAQTVSNATQTPGR